MDKLESWLERRGFDLELSRGADDSVCFTTCVVSINSRSSERTQLYTLLHECGHITVFEQRMKDRKRRVAGSTFRQFWNNCGNARRERAKAVRIGVLTEEIEAWDRGEALASRLKIPYNKKAYHQLRTRSLMTYVRWGAGVKKKGPLRQSR